MNSMCAPVRLVVPLPSEVPILHQKSSKNYTPPHCKNRENQGISIIFLMFLHKSSGICNLLFYQIPDFFKNSSGLNNIFRFFHTFSTFGPLLGLPGARSILVCVLMLHLWLPLAPSWLRLALSRPKLSPSWLDLAASCFNLVASWCNLEPSLFKLVPHRLDLAPHWLNSEAYWLSICLGTMTFT